MPWTRRRLLSLPALIVVLRPLAAAQARDITIAAPPLESLGDYGLGVRLGVTEGERAALLLGHRFALVHEGPARARLAVDAPAASEVPVVALRGVSRGPCIFITGSPPSDDETRLDWHPEFRRYGAGELNERFERAFRQPMTADAWHGWVAVKAIVEASIRGDDLCAELGRLRFDGHKGRALSFDPETRRLRHPALRVRTEGEKQIVEVVP